MSLPHYVVPAGQVRAPRRKCVFAPDKVDHQDDLSIPRSILWHMVKNPLNHQLHEKMIQTCKYFFYYNKVIPVGFMLVKQDKCIMATSDVEDDIEPSVVDLKEGTCKFWLNDFVALGQNEMDLTLLMDRLYHCDVNELRLKSPVPFDVYQKLTSSGTTSILVMRDDVKHPDGSLATVKQLLGHLPNLEKVRWWFGWDEELDENNSVKTLEDAKCFFECLSNLQNLALLDLTNLPEECFPAFVEFAKKNNAVDVRFGICRGISAAYKESIKAFMEETLNFKVPMVQVTNSIADFDQVLYKRYNKLAISTFAGMEIDDFFL